MVNELIGTKYGGFYYPVGLPKLSNDSIVYCVGAGEDITHDIILSKRLNCPVHIFDPTPRAIEHVQLVKDVFSFRKQPINSRRFGGGDINYWNILLQNHVDENKIIMHDYGLYTNDCNKKFYFPLISEHVSCSLEKIGRSDNFMMVKLKTLNTIMKELNHDHIDLLKIDIENVECDVLDKMLDDNIFPTYLSVDFDLMKHDKKRCENVINRIVDNGYTIIEKKGQDISFIRN
uniref:Methyltransferase FkbM domain-containing protein n=1 Tax=viral metagenome TaxID=1070528 RepID=A0A6C0CR07_9ZZZZ